MNGYHALVVCVGLAHAMGALPLGLLVGYAGQLSLGHAAFLGVGAYASGLVAGTMGLPFVAALLVSVVVGAAFASLIGLPALRVRGMHLALVTLAFGLSMYAFVFRLRQLTGGYAGLAVPRPRIGSFVFTNNVHYLGVVLLLFGLVWVVHRNVTRTHLGRAFLALRADEGVAAAFGIDVARYKLIAFVLYGALSALAGAVLASALGSAQQESFGFEISLLYVVVVVLGGARSRVGVAGAAFAFAVAPRLVGSLAGWVPIMGPAAVLVLLVVRPRGFDRGRRRSPLRRHRAASPPVEPLVPEPRPGSALSVRRLVVSFGGVRAVDDLSVDVQAGAITGLIGPNGAGKTTLFNAISGHVRAESGEILLDGSDVAGLPAHHRAQRGLARTFQQIGLVGDMTVVECLVLGLHRVTPYGLVRALAHPPGVARSEAALREAAVQVLRGLDLDRVADAPLSTLSHGQQRIVEIAAAAISSPGLLLLDEPSAGLSPPAVHALGERLRRLREQTGVTILVIEHHMPLVLSLCDEIVAMRSGRVVASGPPEDVRTDPVVVSAFLG